MQKARLTKRAFFCYLLALWELTKWIISGTFNFVYVNDKTGLSERVETGHFTDFKF
jgi:hypothetical protein